jgi:hypothetical protein
MRSALARSCPAIAVVLLTASLPAQAPPGPIIQNHRVTVWDVAPGAASPATTRDVVMFVLQDGQAEVRFRAAGEAATPMPAGARTIVIELQDARVPPLPNTSGLPPAFPRSGSTKALENSRVVAWRSEWAPGGSTPMHFHDKDVVVTYLTDATFESTDARGQQAVTEARPGLTRFNPRDRTHIETLKRGEGRAVMVELK